MYFDGWAALGRIAIVAIISYAVLTAVVRIAGKRTISKMSAFDLVITVALGSTLATVILSKDVSLAGGITALIALSALQYVTSWLFVRFRWFERACKASPSLVLYRQVYQREEMAHVRVSEMDILSAIRKHGRHWDEVEAVVMEIDGSLSVMPVVENKDARIVLSDVRSTPFKESA